MKINADLIEFGDIVNQKIKNTHVNQNQENELKSLIGNPQVNNYQNATTLKTENQLKIVPLFVIILEVVFYILSLEGCYETQTYCLVNLSPGFINRMVIFVCISSFLFTLIIFLTINHNIKAYFLLLQVISLSYLTLIYDTGSDLAYHGSYNRSVFVIMVPIFLIWLYVIRFIYNLIKRKYYKVILFGVIFIILITSLIYLKLTVGCSKRWSKGYYDKEVDNINLPFNTCKLKTPQYCWIDLLDGVLDVSRILSEDCNNFRKGEKEHFLKYLPSHVDKKSLEFYYPNTNLMSFVPNSMFDQFFYNLMDNINTIKSDNNSEVYLKFNQSTNLGEITLSVKRNETLVKLRNEQANKNLNPIKSKNILLIYIDSISRAHFKRKMKKTMEVLDKLLITTKKYSFYQFLKYQAFIYFTQLNTNPMFYGKSMFTKSGTHILKEFHENGYISGHSNNFCSRELYDIEKGYIENLTFIPFDHELASLFCDPNYFSVENPYTPYMGPYSVKRRCLYGKDTSKYVLEYGEMFWETYLGERKFLRLAFQDAHEGTGEVVKYLDENLSVFLEKFITKGWLEDTSIMFVSDHGNNMIGFHNVMNVDDFVIEKTLPALYILHPDSFFRNNNINKEGFDQIMKLNENIMITPYDIYNTILDLIGVNTFNKNGQSLLRKIEDGDKRNCKKYEQDMDKLWCRCMD